MIATCPLDTDVRYTVIATEICTVLHNVAAILYYTILYYTILYYTILYLYTMLYYAMLYYTIYLGAIKCRRPPSNSIKTYDAMQRTTDVCVSVSIYVYRHSWRRSGGSRSNRSKRRNRSAHGGRRWHITALVIMHY